MKQISRITFFIYLLWMLLVEFLNFRGYIAFGHGLGDLYYLISLIFFSVSAIYFYLQLVKGKYSRGKAILFVIYLLMVIIFYCLRLTYLRGAEYPWNGNLFL